MITNQVKRLAGAMNGETKDPYAARAWVAYWLRATSSQKQKKTIKKKIKNQK